jgi:hypothetical protein
MTWFELFKRDFGYNQNECITAAKEVYFYALEEEIEKEGNRLMGKDLDEFAFILKIVDGDDFEHIIRKLARGEKVSSNLLPILGHPFSSGETRFSGHIWLRGVQSNTLMGAWKRAASRTLDELEKCKGSAVRDIV